jgi:hypothetical protein
VARTPLNCPRVRVLCEKSLPGGEGVGIKMIKECRFIKTNGLKCHSPAMRSSCFCYFHGRTRICVSRAQKKDKPLQLPPLGSPGSILAALNQVFYRRSAPATSTPSAPAICFTLSRLPPEPHRRTKCQPRSPARRAMITHHSSRATNHDPRLNTRSLAPMRPTRAWRRLEDRTA